MKTITSANAVVLLQILNLYPIPVRLQGFAADAAFATATIDTAEVTMGVDGKLSGGYTPNPYVQTFSFQADSDSVDIFEQWHLAQQVSKELYVANGTISIPSLNRSYVATKGFLTSYSPAPDGKKTLQPRVFVVTWEAVVGAPLALSA